jgi:hypothetical protein
MANPIDQQVIDFTANYTERPPESINGSTTLESLGIVTEEDTMQYTMELEDNFRLTFEDGDADGIINVGLAIALIKRKMGG